jgi:hypothetical protein
VSKISDVIAPWHFDRLVFVRRRLREHTSSHTAEETACWWAARKSVTMRWC